MTANCKHDFPIALGCPQCIDEAEEAKRAADHKARDEQQRREREAFFALARLAIVAAVKALGSTCKSDSLSEMIVDGVDVRWGVSFDRERAHTSSWRSHETNKVRIVTGDYGNRVSYPQRKDGTHNYEAIARYLVAKAASKKAGAAASQQRQRNSVGVAAFAKDHNLDWSSPIKVEATADADRPMQLNFSLSRCVTYAEAEKIVAALRAAGVAP